MEMNALRCACALENCDWKEVQKWNQLAVTSDRPKHLSEPGEEPIRSFEPANFILIRNSCKTVSFGDAGCPLACCRFEFLPVS